MDLSSGKASWASPFRIKNSLLCVLMRPGTFPSYMYLEALQQLSALSPVPPLGLWGSCGGDWVSSSLYPCAQHNACFIISIEHLSVEWRQNSELFYITKKMLPSLCICNRLCIVGTPLGFVLSCGDRSFFSMARSCKVPGGIFAHFLWLSLLLYHLLL